LMEVGATRAAVRYEFGQPLVVEEVEIDRPQSGEVLFQTAACAICHSDIRCIRGEWGGQTPIAVGHEAAGTVMEVGSGRRALPKSWWSTGRRWSSCPATCRWTGPACWPAE